ncbi:histidinol phosphate aminotransferase apoenzyme [Desulfatibacillum alkenivorans DSM 16219]|jgi:histidinol-phosphate aminotransferase|uniref:Histidinol-phosphate aminotransferase n=1 Tax=Desulfatibacillum alkenivorans DSM 16219 TaxID=1121393 RepID=A0A1M6HTF4_9BACT|nr:histidinol-phosphate transaminase [Desulfatibacillum alkenivorans]SHJ25479.1 histidinol phosphate aminotransferase apoenzyme [Desulfatibacillum alkenivorans DSM 16219]
MKPTAPEYFNIIPPYVPGKPMEELERECGITDSIKLASNENPHGPSPKAVEAVKHALTNLHRYPDGAAPELMESIASKMGCKTSQIVLGNGSDEVIDMLAKVYLNAGDEALMTEPSFMMYSISALAQGAKAVKIPLTQDYRHDFDALAKAVTDKTKIIFLNSPQNPSGTVITKVEFEPFLEKVDPSILIVMDEAYIEFNRDPEAVTGLDYLNGGHTVVTLRTFSKLYGLAGLRIGFGVMPEHASQMLNRIRPPFNINIPAQVAALAALNDAEFVEKTLETVHNGLDFLFDALKALDVVCYPTQTNFFMIDLKQDAKAVYEALLHKGVIIRPLGSYGFDNHIRVTVGLPQENERFVKALKDVMTGS